MAPQRAHRETILKAGSAECQRLCRKPDEHLKFVIDQERLTLAQIWDVPDHIKSVKRLEREAAALQREREYAWRKFKVHGNFSALNAKAGQQAGTSKRAVRIATSPSLLPAYSLALRDHEGRLFPFMRTTYFNAATTKPGAPAAWLSIRPMAHMCWTMVRSHSYPTWAKRPKKSRKRSTRSRR